MEDTLLYMTEASVKRFVAAICDFVPLKTEVINANEVINTFYTQEQIEQLGAPKPKIPLFHIDLTVGVGDNGKHQPKYSTSAKDVVKSILNIFENGIKSL